MLINVRNQYVLLHMATEQSTQKLFALQVGEQNRITGKAHDYEAFKLTLVIALLTGIFAFRT